MVEPTDCEKFRKQGGGRGKPARDALCADCGVVWTDHPRAEKPKPQKRAIKFRRPDTPPAPKPVVLDEPASNPFDEPVTSLVEQPIDEPKESERTPEEEARVRASLERLFEEFFGPDCPTDDDW
jgi:hypothetical protein